MRKLCLIVICVVFCSTSVFSREYKSLDKWAYKTPVSAEKSIETLAEYLKKAPNKGKLSEDEAKARLAYAWIVSHILYDDFRMRQIEDMNKKKSKGREQVKATRIVNDDIFITRVGVCGDIAMLYVRLAKAMGLEAVYISGKSQGEKHAWNAVKVDGQWRLLDATWDVADKPLFQRVDNIREYEREIAKRERKLNKNFGTTTERKKKSKNKWFFVKPKVMIKTHTPNDVKWRLF